jgi:hypothetical protein
MFGLICSRSMLDKVKSLSDEMDKVRVRETQS